MAPVVKAPASLMWRWCIFWREAGKILERGGGQRERWPVFWFRKKVFHWICEGECWQCWQRLLGSFCTWTHYTFEMWENGLRGGKNRDSVRNLDVRTVVVYAGRAVIGGTIALAWTAGCSLWDHLWLFLIELFTGKWTLSCGYRGY